MVCVQLMYYTAMARMGSWMSLAQPRNSNRAVNSICVESGKVRMRLNHLEFHRGCTG